MDLVHTLTAFHDPSDPRAMLVSARVGADGPRSLHRVPRPPACIVRRDRATGVRDLCDTWKLTYPPVHGQVVDGREHFAVPPDWRWALPPEHELPTIAPPWLRCTLFFVWGTAGIAALGDLHNSARVSVFRTTTDAMTALCAHPDWSTDVLFVCTSAAADFMERQRQRCGWLELARTLPVVCPVDTFVRTTSLDRMADGTASWYRAPFHFVPDELHALSEARRDTLVRALVENRRQWMVECQLLAMLFSLCALTRLPLHEAAVAQQTMLADALVELVWMRAPLEFDAPRPVMGDPTEEDLRRFQGASVLDAKLGLHRKMVLMPDVRALYPSVVLEYMRDEYPLMAALFAHLIALRATQTDPVRAASIKVITSSRYGTLKYGRYRNPALAERITAAGRHVQTESLEALRNATLPGVDVIGGDTDSLALSVDAMHNVQTLMPRLVKVLNGQRQHTLYKGDVDCFSCVFFVSNKSWAGVRASDGRIVTRGMAVNRSVTPRFLLDAHHEWVRRVLTDDMFPQSAQTRTEWIERRATELRATVWSVADLVVWPKPTRTHPDTNRGYVVVRHSHAHVPYADYLQPGTTQLPVDVDYLVQLYFRDELLRQHQLLCV